MVDNSAAETPASPLDDEGSEQRIRERAYRLWEADGRPHGRDAEFWERARELDGMSTSSGAGLLPIKGHAVVEEAGLQANLGEFPDRLADQGEHLTAPMTRAKAAAADSG